MASLLRSAAGMSGIINSQPLKQSKIKKQAQSTVAQENLGNIRSHKQLGSSNGSSKSRIRRALGDISNKSSGSAAMRQRKPGTRRALANISNGRSREASKQRSKAQNTINHESKAESGCQRNLDLELEFTHKGPTNADPYDTFNLGVTASDMLHSLQHSRRKLKQELGIEQDDKILAAGFDDGGP